MLTNLVASIVVSLVTNTTERWPQKLDGEKPNPGYASWAENKHTHPYTLEYCPPTVQNWIDDTNADTKSIEFTVAARRLLFFSFEQRTLEHELTNWTEAHWLVNMERVRTNAYRSCPSDWIVQTDSNPNRDAYMTEPGWIFDHTDHGWIFDRKATNYWRKSLSVPLPIGPFQTTTNGLVYWIIGTNICYDLPKEFYSFSK